MVHRLRGHGGGVGFFIVSVFVVLVRFWHVHRAWLGFSKALLAATRRNSGKEDDGKSRVPETGGADEERCRGREMEVNGDVEPACSCTSHR